MYATLARELFLRARLERIASNYLYLSKTIQTMTVKRSVVIDYLRTKEPVGTTYRKHLIVLDERVRLSLLLDR